MFLAGYSKDYCCCILSSIKRFYVTWFCKFIKTESFSSNSTWHAVFRVMRNINTSARCVPTVSNSTTPIAQSAFHSGRRLKVPVKHFIFVAPASAMFDFEVWFSVLATDCQHLTLTEMWHCRDKLRLHFEFFNFAFWFCFWEKFLQYIWRYIMTY